MTESLDTGQRPVVKTPCESCPPDPARNQFPHTQRDVTGEDLVTVLGHPDNMVRDVVNCVTVISIIHRSFTVAGCGGLLYAFRKSGDEICPPEGGGLNLTHGKSN